MYYVLEVYITSLATTTISTICGNYFTQHIPLHIPFIFIFIMYTVATTISLMLITSTSTSSF